MKIVQEIYILPSNLCLLFKSTQLQQLSNNISSQLHFRLPLMLLKATSPQSRKKYIETLIKTSPQIKLARFLG